VGADDTLTILCTEGKIGGDSSVQWSFPATEERSMSQHDEQDTPRDEAETEAHRTRFHQPAEAADVEAHQAENAADDPKGTDTEAHGFRMGDKAQPADAEAHSARYGGAPAADVDSLKAHEAEAPATDDDDDDVEAHRYSGI
jgi:hypothetical protein